MSNEPWWQKDLDRQKSAMDAGKIGPEIKSHERLKELLEAKKAVYWNRSVIPMAVINNLQYGQVCICLEKGYFREYDKNGGFK